jgi:hypothetical protein
VVTFFLSLHFISNLRNRMLVRIEEADLSYPFEATGDLIES